MKTMVLLLILAVGASGALAQVPDPGNSGLPDAGPPGAARLGASPVNDQVPPASTYTFRYVLRDETNAPVPDFPASDVALDFSACTRSSTRPDDQVQPDGPSDANGEIEWVQSLTFGGADPCEVGVLVLDMEFGVLEGGPSGGVRSPDMNGDGFVSLGDLQTFQTAFVAQEPAWIGDLAPDFDGLISLADLVQFQVHFQAL